jgi:Domain of unknown function (DUF4360)
MINTIAAAVMALSTVVVPSAERPPPGEVTIEVVTVNGSGCRAGTVSLSVAQDNSAFYALYSDYLAAVGVGTRPTDFRKNCQLALQVHAPAGFTFAINQVDHTGFAHLESGATGTERSNHYFQGMTTPGYWTHTFKGPLNDDWLASDRSDLPVEPPYRPCHEKRYLYVNTELRVSAGTSDPKTTTSYMAMDSIDNFFGTVHHFAWKRCK